MNFFTTLAPLVVKVNDGFLCRRNTTLSALISSKILCSHPSAGFDTIRVKGSDMYCHKFSVRMVVYVITTNSITALF